jgi:hypothetical protein
MFWHRREDTGYEQYEFLLFFVIKVDIMAVFEQGVENHGQTADGFAC